MSAKTKQFWSRLDVQLAVGAAVLATLGVSLGAAVVWGALMIWQRDFRRRYSNWYKWWVLGGLVAAWQLEYPLSTKLNVPPSWVAATIVTACVVVALVGQRRRQRDAWHNWR